MNAQRDMTPASVRRPLQSSRFVQTLEIRASRMVKGAVPEARRKAGISMFLRLPHEPEDARMTGGTRSLERRLLALNLDEARVERKLPG